MGRRGQRAEVKEAKGNPGRRPIRKSAPDAPAPTDAPVDGSLPDWVNTAKAVTRRRPTTQKARAEWMTQLTEAIWNYVRPELVAMKLVKKIDEPGLAIYCRAFAEYIAAIIELDRDGTTYKTESPHSGVMVRLHPAMNVRKQALQTMKEHAEMLGITPLARQRLFHMMATAPGATGLPIERAANEANEVSPEAKSPIGLLASGPAPSVN